MTSPEHVLIGIVEDDPVMGGSLVQRLELEGYAPMWWQTGGDALAGLKRQRPDLLICDIRLPDMTGEDIFRQALSELGTSPVLFITAYGDIEQAVRLVRGGADDYLTKPFDIDDLLERIERLLGEQRATRSACSSLGLTEPMRRIEALLRRVADIDSSVLFTGESGVGKEVAARFLHQVSARASSPFMAVNCAAIPGKLMESELFGHERGAFTGAHSRHEGYAERARDSILFLDEVGDLPAPLQAKLLRLLHDRTFHRVGGNTPIICQARVICSTNRDLEALVAAGGFREDLFYRINVIPVTIPPLRSRPDDILPLLRGYVRHFSETFHRPVRGLTNVGEETALAHDWPGNVRELRNRVERAVALADQSWIGPVELFPDLRLEEASQHASFGTLAEAREAAERRQIERALAHTGGRVAKAAELLGVSRTTLWEKMRRIGLTAAGET
jgi:DNA-binding NtrC family response regulator